MKKVCVTGADGMLGSHVVRELLARNIRVRALVQPGRETGTLDGLNIEKRNGDLTDSDSINESISGCDAVVHIAASTQIWPSRSAKIWAINYHAVTQLAATVLAQNNTSLIHIGSANSFAPGSKSSPGDETGPYVDGKFGLDYQDSKYAAQEFLLSMHRERGLAVKIINPGFMFGAFDSKPGAGQMLLSLYSGAVPGFTSGGKSYVPAIDVATAICNALTMGEWGECYLASGTNLDYREAFTLFANTLGVPAPTIHIPATLTNIGGALSSLWGTVSGTTPKISLPMARLSHTECYYSNKKAVRHLQMPRSSLATAVEECFKWLQEHGYVG